jgi:hypothetical protein
MADKAPSLSVDAKRKIRATDKRARLALRKCLIEYWKSTARCDTPQVPKSPPRPAKVTPTIPATSEWWRNALAIPQENQAAGRACFQHDEDRPDEAPPGESQPHEALPNALAVLGMRGGGFSITPGRTPAKLLTSFERSLGLDFYVPAKWETGFERYCQTCFDVRVEQHIQSFQDSDKFLKFLQGAILPEVLKQIEGPRGLWPDLMAATRKDAGFYGDDPSKFRSFVSVIFRLDTDSLRRFLLNRAEVWMCQHLEPKAERKRKGPMPEAEQYLSSKENLRTAEAANVLGVTEHQIRRLVKIGPLKTVGKGQNKRITSESVRSYLFGAQNSGPTRT